MSDLAALVERIRARVDGRVESSLPLAPLTTYRLGGRAGVYIEPAGRGDLEALAAVIAEADRSVPVLPLGRGSNLVFSDAGFDGIVIRLTTAFATISGADDRVTVGAGASLPQLTNWAARRGLAGVEFAIAIPGSMGGGVRMNAGAHGADVSTVLTAAEVIDLTSGAVGRLDRGELGLQYRRSGLGDRQLVLGADLELATEAVEAVKARVEEYRRHRAETQPPAVQNAGSVFKNPTGDHAGRLVEAAGLKGYAVGGASVSELHANFFIAGKGATAQDVFDLVQAVRTRVHDHAGVWLEPEVRFVGEFAGREEAA